MMWCHQQQCWVPCQHHVRNIYAWYEIYTATRQDNVNNKNKIKIMVLHLVSELGAYKRPTDTPVRINTRYIYSTSCTSGGVYVSNLVFYAQSTITDISGRMKFMHLVLIIFACQMKVTVGNSVLSSSVI